MDRVVSALIAALILGLMVLAMAVQSFIAHKYTDYYESLLTRCSFVTGNKITFQHLGLRGKLMRTGLVSMVLAMPSLFVRRGLIDIEEVKRFPSGARRLLVSLLAVHVSLATALIIFTYA